jgi:hypothetical protein
MLRENPTNRWTPGFALENSEWIEPLARDKPKVMPNILVSAASTTTPIISCSLQENVDVTGSTSTLMKELTEGGTGYITTPSESGGTMTPKLTTQAQRRQLPPPLSRAKINY